MNGIIMRIRMRRCLRRLEKIWFDNNDIVVGEAARSFCDTRSKLKVLKALQAVECVTLSFQDNSNRPYAIRPGDRSYIYALERFELWMNRVISFLAGIMTAVAADYIIKLISSLPPQ